MKIDGGLAATLLRQEAQSADAGGIDADWEQRVEHLSHLCETGASKTHIAFLGTAMLARSLSGTVDLFAIKPSHAPGNAHAYSARTLCHGVLVPIAAELKFSIGVTGREPLNNQPYFRMTKLGDGTPVHSGGRRAFDYMLELVTRLASGDPAEARRALRAYIAVRRRYQPRYTVASDAATTPHRLMRAIIQLTADASEGGRRAQAVVAGLFEIFAGQSRVESGRINDPSRHYPGDVCVLSADGTTWEKAIEVRDKAVSESDIRLFANKCGSAGVREAAVVMVAASQPRIDPTGLRVWAEDLGIGITLFSGWPDLVAQALFWSTAPQVDEATLAAGAIRRRLIDQEVCAETVQLWDRLTNS